MKLKIFAVILMLVSSLVIVSPSLSYAQTDNSTAPVSTPVSNQTVVNQTSVNATSFADNSTNVGLQISSFVHNATAEFQVQKSETRKTMLECRDRIQAANPGDIEQIREDCKIQLNAIKQKYQQDRMKFQEFFKTYRESVLTFMKEAKGQHVEKIEMDKAFEHIKNKMKETDAAENVTLGHGKGMMATKDNTDCLNPSGKPTGRC